MLRDVSIENGMKTLENECKDLVLNGMTTIEELSAIVTLSIDNLQLSMKEQVLTELKNIFIKNSEGRMKI